MTAESALAKIIDDAIDDQINTADIILLLVNPDFLASDYCYNREMSRTMERHEAGVAAVIPVILRPCDWHEAPFGKLLASPLDGRPVTQWPDRDQAFLQVARAIRGVAEHIRGKSAHHPASSSLIAANEHTTTTSTIIRSSNLRITKHFTERDKDKFQQDAFDYMA